MSKLVFLAIVITAIPLAGCVVVNPSNVSVGGFGSPSPRKIHEPEMETAYADALRKVARQQNRVASELQHRDWEELADESGDWVKYVRELSGYAGRSHDPALFRQYSDALLAATEDARIATARRDPQACQSAIRRCDPILDRFFRDFPLSIEPARHTVRTPARRTQAAESDSVTVNADAEPHAVNVHVRVP